MLNTRSRRQHILEHSPSIVYNRATICETGVLPPNCQLIRDRHTFEVMGTKKVLVEDLNGKQVPVMRVTGLFQLGETVNANGRVYSTPILSSATRAIQEDVAARAVYGEYDHPADAKIHLDRVSHLITKVWLDGPKVYGEAEILDNQVHGRALRGLFERKCRVGISSRGVGDMEMRESANGPTYYVQEGYMFITWDAVADPSVSNATLMVMEGLNRRLKPIKESASKGLLRQSQYQTLLINEVNKYFGLKDFGPR